MERKLLSSLLCFLLCISVGKAQNQENFENETQGQTSFTENLETFNITTQAGGSFIINSVGTQTGWNGTAKDDKYIDNYATKANNVPFKFTISSAGAKPFFVKSMYVYLANYLDNIGVSGDFTIVGKLATATKFTATGSSGFNQALGYQNGFTLINMVNFGGSDNSKTLVDELVFTSTNSFHYAAIDAFKWLVYAPITASISQTDISCFGGTNGTATVTASNGLPPYTYSWSPSGGTGVKASGLGIGSYTCTITDATANSITKTVTITQPTAALAATTSQTNIACFGGTTGSATVTATGGTLPYSYAWSSTGGNVATATGLTAGSYTCTITDFNGCTLTKTFTLTQPSTALTANPTQTAVSCFGGLNGSATVAASGGTPGYTYSWSPSGGSAASATGLSATGYTCTITDSKGCTLLKTFTIAEPTQLTATATPVNVSCNNGTNGSATIVAAGGTPAYTYAWAPSGGTAATATGLGAGSYTCTITDSKGCIITKNVSITEPAALTAAISGVDVACHGASSGSATVIPAGGTPSYTYNWTLSGGSAATATGLATGSYTCTITDMNSCSITKTITINQPATALTATTTDKDVSCNGGTDGSATVVAAGGTPAYTYAWAPSGGTAATASGLTATGYTCTITDSKGCMITKTFSIDQPATALTANSTQTAVSCFGGSNGSAEVTASGGTPGYTYSWSPLGGSAASATGLSATGYTCTITDSKGCTLLKTFTIAEPTQLTATATPVNVSCNNGTNGSATIVAAGGTPAYTYAWVPSGGTAATATGLGAGSYTCTITDSKGCIITKNVSISEPAALTATLSSTDVACHGASNGSATVTPAGGTPSYTYNWALSGGSAATATGLAAGSYTCTITDVNSCSITKTITINQPATALTATATDVAVSCNGGTDGSATVVAAGGTLGYTYSWSPSGGTAATASGLTAKSYTCTVTDANNCIKEVTVTITEPAAIIGTQTVTICASSKLVVGDSVYTTSGTFVNKFEAFNGCDSIFTTHLTVDNPVNVTVTANANVLTANATNSTYQWIDCENNNSIIVGETNQHYTVAKDGSYAVIVATNDCKDTSACIPMIITGISQFAISDQLHVYPNPSNGIVTIRATIAGTYTIMNELGQTVRSFLLNSANNYTTTISELSNGAYYVIGINSNQFVKQKIIVVQ